MRKALIKSILIVLITFVISVPLIALAQMATSTPIAPETIDLNTLLSQLLGTVSAWKAGGWLAGMVAVVNFLTNLTKWKPIDDALKKAKFGWWLRPVLAVVLGILTGVFSSIVGGAPVGIGIIGAILAGLSSTGFHELWTALTNDRVKAERLAGAKLVDALSSADKSATEKIEPFKSELDRIAALPTPPERLTALISFAKTHAPQ